jgi:hypothetical protein
MSEYKLKPLKTSERHDKKLRGEFEDGLSRSPAEAGAPGEAPGESPPVGPFLPDTSGTFALSGNKPIHQITCTKPEVKPERLIESERQDVDQLADRKS